MSRDDCCAKAYDDLHRPYMHAQKLCNRASFLITSARNYKEGIILLTEALKLTEQDIASSKSRRPCEYDFFVLESSLSMGEDSFSSIIENERANYYQNNSENKSVDLHTSLHHGEEKQIGKHDHQKTFLKYEHKPREDNQPVIDVQNHDGFIYHRPLLVNMIIVDGDYHKGLTLPLIILFNLAIAHHLMAVSIQRKTTYCKSSQLQVLEQALHLYQLAYELYLCCFQQSNMIGDHKQSFGSIRFTMIITNNLSEIHRLTGNSAKYEMCLQHLMSGICMFMFDSRLERLDPNHMNGFYENLKPILGNDVCANAA